MQGWNAFMFAHTLVWIPDSVCCLGALSRIALEQRTRNKPWRLLGVPLDPQQGACNKGANIETGWSPAGRGGGAGRGREGGGSSLLLLSTPPPRLNWSWAGPWVWCYCLLPALMPGDCVGRDTIQKGQCSRLNGGNTIPAAGQWWLWTSSKWPYFRVRVSTPPMCPSPQLPVCCWDIGCKGCNIKKA